jgi:nucleoside-triphosphatase THEP1
MKAENKLSTTWLKAAVLGCLWASSEIVLGSFLHNLRIPFSSVFLTGIGIVLLISVSYQWKDKGLIWRSGLICALMKSISPSAVIFGPMIAIFSEALLLEFSVRMLGRNMIGFFIGSLMAMSWNFFQKIATYIIFYGFNIVDLYTSLIKFAEKQLHYHFDNVWMPVIALWIYYLVFGALSAIIGIHIGKSALNKSIPMLNKDSKRISEIKGRRNTEPATYSLPWLALDFIGMIAVLLLMNSTGIIWWGTAGLVLISIWAVRYRNSLRPLRKPKFWVGFILITMLSSYLFSRFQPGQVSLTDGLLIGLQMNFRAALMIIGFTAIGKELGNPVIRSFFMRTSFKQLPLALEVAFETLPFVIANAPSFRNFLKKPLSVMKQVVSQSEFWLERVALSMKKKSNVIIISGEINDGKSTLMHELAVRFKGHNIQAGGIVSPAILENGIKAGYALLNVATGEKMRLSQTEKGEGMANVGRYYFLNDGIEFGKAALAVAKNQNSKIVFIDEIGTWELQGQGWAASLNELIIRCDMPLIIAVHMSIVDLVVENWQLQNPLIIEAKNSSIDGAFDNIIAFAGLI